MKTPLMLWKCRLCHQKSAKIGAGTNTWRRFVLNRYYAVTKSSDGRIRVHDRWSDHRAILEFIDPNEPNWYEFIQKISWERPVWPPIRRELS